MAAITRSVCYALTLSLVALLCGGVGFKAAPSLAASSQFPTYRVTDLGIIPTQPPSGPLRNYGNPQPYYMADNGEMAGIEWLDQIQDAAKPVIWHDGAAHVIPLPSLYRSASPAGINAGDEIAMEATLAGTAACSTAASRATSRPQTSARQGSKALYVATGRRAPDLPRVLTVEASRMLPGTRHSARDNLQGGMVGRACALSATNDHSGSAFDRLNPKRSRR
jgi:hypothetical protein